MEHSSDVLIIGGGAIGLSAAHYLTRAGASVTLVDREGVGHGCSLHNAGFISPSHFVPLASPGIAWQAVRWMLNPRSPFYIQPRVSLDLIRWAVRFWRSCDMRVVKRAMPLLRDLLTESSLLTDELSKDTGMKFTYVKRGLCELFTSPGGRRHCEHESLAAADLGVEARLLDEAGLHALDPDVEFRAKGGLFYPGDSHLVPSEFVRDMAASVAGAGCTLIENCEVTGFAVRDGRINEVHTTGGSLRARDCVFAGGVWTTELLRKIGVRLLMQGGKGYSITVSRPAVKPTRSYILTERRVAVTPFPDSLRFAGTMEITGLNLRLNRPRINTILDAIPVYFGNVVRPDPEAAQLWAGLRPVTPDGLPYLGRTRNISNAVVAAGHAMLGISLAAVSGKLVSEIVGGKAPAVDISLLSPNRFE